METGIETLRIDHSLHIETLVRATAHLRYSTVVQYSTVKHSTVQSIEAE